MTTAGISVEGLEPPFDAEREKREPMWGDPTYRRIPRTLFMDDYLWEKTDMGKALKKEAGIK